MTVQFLCSSCERQEILPVPLEPGTRVCEGCRKEFPTFTGGPSPETKGLSRCFLCGGERFYTQRDFNQRLGCLIAGVGAALSPFTYGISLLACLIVDLVLYFVLKEATLCYRCGAVYRGLPKNPEHGAFDLHVAEVVEEERKYLERVSS